MAKGNFFPLTDSKGINHSPLQTEEPTSVREDEEQQPKKNK